VVRVYWASVSALEAALEQLAAPGPHAHNDTHDTPSYPGKHPEHTHHQCGDGGW
jgi:hypothetical protein